MEDPNNEPQTTGEASAADPQESHQNNAVDLGKIVQDEVDAAVAKAVAPLESRLAALESKPAHLSEGQMEAVAVLLQRYGLHPENPAAPADEPEVPAADEHSAE